MLSYKFTYLPQNCDSQELRVTTSRSGYPKKRTLPLTQDFCLVVSKIRGLCKDPQRKKAFEEHYKHESSLPNGAKLTCSIIEGAQFRMIDHGIGIVLVFVLVLGLVLVLVQAECAQKLCRLPF